MHLLICDSVALNSISSLSCFYSKYFFLFNSYSTTCLYVDYISRDSSNVSALFFFCLICKPDFNNPKNLTPITIIPGIKEKMKNNQCFQVTLNNFYIFFLILSKGGAKKIQKISPDPQNLKKDSFHSFCICLSAVPQYLFSWNFQKFKDGWEKDTEELHPNTPRIYSALIKMEHVSFLHIKQNCGTHNFRRLSDFTHNVKIHKYDWTKMIPEAILIPKIPVWLSSVQIYWVICFIINFVYLNLLSILPMSYIHPFTTLTSILNENCVDISSQSSIYLIFTRARQENAYIHFSLSHKPHRIQIQEKCPRIPYSSSSVKLIHIPYFESKPPRNRIITQEQL
ncbi:hypothetical protein VP01_4241g1 [Puccinia sorghi]|uniref:Uncharacterized protein n=1 Tax=Puccinia sorghi TaxID=27349 RepID=A0A0L6USF6_9BASI|nr:hypothetical protein VP01_4241g1 [Puccinia sorghi]